MSGREGFRGGAEAAGGASGMVLVFHVQREMPGDTQVQTWGRQLGRGLGLRRGVCIVNINLGVPTLVPWETASELEVCGSVCSLLGSAPGSE